MPNKPTIDLSTFIAEPADLFGDTHPPLKYLVNVNVLTTGFDAPNVDCIVVLRPTASPGLYYQMVGRGFRLCPGKADCLVLDYGGNILAFDDKELAGLLDTDVQQGLTDPDAVPLPPDEATTRRGDIWVLGDHRLMCGDSASPEDMDRLLDGAMIQLCNTDPPQWCACRASIEQRHRGRAFLFHEHASPEF